MPITPTTCFNKIAALTKPVRIIQGGTSAGKTFSILQYLILCATNKELHISIVGENVPALKRGAYKDFINILKQSGSYDEANHNLTDRKYTLNKSTFEFFGADSPDSLRGGRRDILFINECNNVSFEAYQELSIRTRLFTFLDYNPTAPFWATKDLIGQDTSEHIVVNYKDNEFLEQKIVEEIEGWQKKAETSEYYKNRWRVMGLGLMGKQEGAIITDWQEIDFLPPDAQLIASGLDWGYNDPTSLISLYRFDGELIVDEKLYQSGILNSQIASKIKSTDAKEGIIYGDSASPQSIAEMRAYGLTVLPVVKGKDSINYGLSLIQEQPIKVTARSTNLIKELQNYTWAKDRNGTPLNVPIDSFNHAIDSLRYIFLMKFGKRKTNSGIKKWKLL